MLRKKNLIFLLLAVVVFCAAVFTFVVFLETGNARETVGYTDAEDFEGIFIPSDENNGLFFDTEGYAVDDGICIFLPSTADASKLVFYSVGKDGSYLERFQHDFSLEDMEIQGTRVYVMKSENPAINLQISSNAPSLNDIEASEDHDLYTSGIMELQTVSGDRVQQRMKMRGRGNITWLADKKSYQITLDKRENLLGMGSAKKWALVANSGDYSLLRNEVFLSLAADMGLPYPAKIQEVDLFINGEYHGEYSLCTKVEVGENRVNIEKNDYLYCLLDAKENNTQIVYDDPSLTGDGDYKHMFAELRDCDDINVIEKSMKYVQNVINEFYDPTSDLADVDLISLAKYYWLQEFSKTTDPTVRSVYLYWNSGEQKMYTGPAWDYDRTAGIIEMPFLEEDYIWPSGWTARKRDYYNRLFENPVFTDAVKDVYENYGVKEAFRKAADEVDERIERNDAAARMNFVRWSIPEEQSNKVLQTYQDNSYDSQVRWLSEWLTMRADWIEEEMEGQE
ncbi:MAG: CotH kinase family protein [Lachnospiraceae bacterium]|nr:CotH kinase family protein [Lachnospiraceae bacterium]